MAPDRRVWKASRRVKAAGLDAAYSEWDGPGNLVDGHEVPPIVCKAGPCVISTHAAHAAPRHRPSAGVRREVDPRAGRFICKQSKRREKSAN